tara:strand:- start:1201 stop:1671 length:471 start_codon:yes stop_codon:yes gene_type:complete
MIKKGYILLLVVLAVVSCHDIERPKKPDNFIEREEMTDILYDISLLRALKTYSVNDMRALGLEPDTFIYDKYDVDSLQLAQSIDYYSVNFNEYTSIWEEVNARLTAQRDEIQFEQNDLDSIRIEESKRKRDSIKKANQPRPDIELENDSILTPVSS